MPKDGTINRERILDSATHLVIENGFAATSLDHVIAAAGTSKGAFFHHFASKLELAQALTERYVEADIAVLNGALTAVSDISDPVERLIAFMRFFEDGADELMEEQSSCLYISVLTEQQLISQGTAQSINRAIEAWRHEIVDLLKAATAAADVDLGDLEALADHAFVTFEGAFLLARSTGEPAHMRTQLGVVRRLLESALRVR